MKRWHDLTTDQLRLLPDGPIKKFYLIKRNGSVLAARLGGPLEARKLSCADILLTLDSLQRSIANGLSKPTREDEDAQGQDQGEEDGEEEGPQEDEGCGQA